MKMCVRRLQGRGCPEVAGVHRRNSRPIRGVELTVSAVFAVVKAVLQHLEGGSGEIERRAAAGGKCVLAQRIQGLSLSVSMLIGHGRAATRSIQLPKEPTVRRVPEAFDKDEETLARRRCDCGRGIAVRQQAGEEPERASL